MGEGYLNIEHCRSCGARIRFIRMTSGKYMPVDESAVFYDLEKSSDKVVTTDGRVVNCRIVEQPVNRSMFGFVSHFATCPNANQHRR